MNSSALAISVPTDFNDSSGNTEHRNSGTGSYLANSLTTIKPRLSTCCTLLSLVTSLAAIDVC